MSIEVVPATGDLLERILDDTFPVWGEGLDRAAYGRYNRAQLATAWGASHLRRVALVENGRLLATAKRYHLTGRLEGEPVPDSRPRRRVHPSGRAWPPPRGHPAATTDG